MMNPTVTRRRLAAMTGAGIAALVGGKAALAQDASPVASPASGSPATTGVAGGGTLQGLGGGAVSFVLAVVPVPDPVGVVSLHGTFRLVDETEPSIPIVLESLRFETFGLLSPGSMQGRQIVGWASMNGAGEYPFLLQVEDLGEAGTEEDQFNLVFGADAEPFLGGEAKNCDCGGVSYSLRSRVVTGDITLFGDA